VAVACKLAIIMHRMWVEETDFRFWRPAEMCSNGFRVREPSGIIDCRLEQQAHDLAMR